MVDLRPSRTPLDLAHDDLDRIDRAIADLQKERQEVESFIKRYGKYVLPSPPVPTKRPPEVVQTLPSQHRNLLLPMSNRIAAFMAQYLAEKDRPVELPDFYPVLEEKGLIPGGTNPKQAVSAILGKDKRFTFVPREGWKLAPTGELPPGLTGRGELNLS